MKFAFSKCYFCYQKTIRVIKRLSGLSKDYPAYPWFYVIAVNGYKLRGNIYFLNDYNVCFCDETLKTFLFHFHVLKGQHSNRMRDRRVSGIGKI